jgi:hypothetical protein
VTTISLQVAGLGYCIGCALLALWTLLRFPRLGPQTLRGAMIACGLALGVTSATSPAMQFAVATADAAAALLLVALPILMYAFWSAGVLLRVFAGMVGSAPR